MAGKPFQNTNNPTHNQLVQWINDAGMSDGPKKVNLLRKTTEVLLHQGSEFIPLFIDNILSFFSDKSNDVKKQVIIFIEEISKLHPSNLPKVIGQLRLLVGDPVIAVLKRAIQAASILYRNTLMRICKSNVDITDMEFVWEHLTQLKLIVLNMIDSDNEGIRTHSIEHLWDDLKRKVRARNPAPATKMDLKAALIEEWNSMGQDRVKKLIGSMKRRLEAVIRARGGNTKY